MIEPLSNDFGVPMRMSRSSSALLITAMASVLLMSGCKVEAPSMKIFVTYESPEPVDGGSTISTAKLGTVHLGPPLLKANFVGSEEVDFKEISLPHFEEHFLCLGPQIFLQSEMKTNRSTGMSMEEYLNGMSSEFLQSGKRIYLVIECDGRRVAHQLKISQRDDPTGLFIQYSNPYGSQGRRTQVEFLEPLEAPDDFSKKIRIWNSDSNQTLNGGALVFRVRGTSSVGFYKRAKDVGIDTSKKDKDSISTDHMYSDTWFCKETIATWKDSSGNWVGERAYLWPSVPGLHIDMDDPEVINDLRADLRSFERFRFNINWGRIGFTKNGASSKGGAL